MGLITDMANYEEHEPTGACHHHHCSWHNVDEPAGHRPFYLICTECGHLYRTARALRSAERRLYWQMLRQSGVALRRQPTGLKIHWWSAVRLLGPRRAEHIYSCPYCNHDF